MNRPTQVDVARLAGVSRATVSYVLNDVPDARVPDETRQRVLEAIEELGYQPDARAQALRSGSTKTIALIIPDLQNPHFCEYANGIEEAARAAGYHLLLSSTTMNDEYAVEIFRALARRRFDGLIIASSFILEAGGDHQARERHTDRSTHWHCIVSFFWASPMKAMAAGPPSNGIG